MNVSCRPFSKDPSRIQCGNDTGTLQSCMVWHNSLWRLLTVDPQIVLHTTGSPQLMASGTNLMKELCMVMSPL